MRRRWGVWSYGATASGSGRSLLVLFSLSFLFLCKGVFLAPEALRTAHLQRAEEIGMTVFLCMRCFRHISLQDDAFVLLRE
jgi:hypothetical protein